MKDGLLFLRVFSLLLFGFFIVVSAEEIYISGVVKNKQTTTPIAQATVSLEGTKLSTRTDQKGLFTLTGQTTGTLSISKTPSREKLFRNQRGVVIEVVKKGNVCVEFFNLSGKIVSFFKQEGLTPGQWLLNVPLPIGVYVCRVKVNSDISVFKVTVSCYIPSGWYIKKIGDHIVELAPAPRVADAGYIVSFSKTGFVTSQIVVASGREEGLTVLMDTIQFTTGMTEAQVRQMLASILDTDSIIFIKRFTLNSNHYYTEHINADWKPGGNICILNLKTGAVRNVISDSRFTKGVFKRFDISYDGKKVLFDFRSSSTTGYRIYEADIATGTVRQITFPPPNEDSLVRVYRCNNTQCGTDGQSCNVTYHHGTDDMDPCYLPDGGVAFVSTRCQIGTPCDAADCFTTTNLYRIESDGSGMRPLSRSMASEFQPSMMPDGRILYARWEYVDKASAAPKCIWSMYPNGTGSSEVYKNDINVPPTFVQPRYIPGTTNKFVVLATPHCCYQSQYGTVIRLNMNKYIRSREPMEYITKEVDAPDHTVLSWPLSWGKGNTYRDPYPLSEDLYLVSHKPGTVSMNWWEPAGYGLYVLTGENKTFQFYRDPSISCWQPMPLKSRPREPVVAIPLDSALLARNEAVCTVDNIYYNMENVPSGAVKYIRILEQAPRPWSAHHFWTGDGFGLAHAAIARNAHLGLKVQWGIVPVESDGSANFVVPANRAIFFQALDSNFQVVQHSRTYINFMPGERRGCTGCHETPDQAPPIPSGVPLALRRSPSIPGPQPGDSTGKILLDYETRVQPIWDKHCISCHNTTKKSGNLDLSATHTDIFNTSYNQLMDRRNWLLGFYIDEDPRNPVETTKYLPAYTIFSNCILLKIIGIPVTLRDVSGAPTYLARWATQYGTKAEQLTNNHKSRFTLTFEEKIKVSNWIHSNLQYRGSYWGRFNVSYKGMADYRPKVTFDQAIGTQRPW